MEGSIKNGKYKKLHTKVSLPAKVEKKRTQLIKSRDWFILIPFLFFYEN